MKRSLLDIVLIHHPADGVSAPYVNTLKRAVEWIRPDASVSQYSDFEDPWERVFVTACTTGQQLDEVLEREETPTLYLILVSEKLVEDPALRQSLDELALTLPRRKDEGSRNALCYSFSATAINQLPDKLKSRQLKMAGDLGEHQIQPHRLALLAMHRARMLMGQFADATKLKLFISHAKYDGIFFAQALKHAIDQIPELSAWYDAEDIESGGDWENDLEDIASNSVFIALRTPVYDQRKVCRKEFETALLHGVPIVVVDALPMSPVTEPSYLPYSAMPTVRISDGNTHRVLIAALREHLRILLMQAIAREKLVDCADVEFRVWPRLPCVAAIRRADITSRVYWLVPQSITFEAEFLATRDWLDSIDTALCLEILEQFRPISVLRDTAVAAADPI